MLPEEYRDYRDDQLQQLIDEGEGVARISRITALTDQVIGLLHADVSQSHTSLVAQSRELIPRRVNETTRDLSYAMDIKAEGNLLFALLNSAVEADSEVTLGPLRERFVRTLTAFRVAADGFSETQLAQRNPILATNVSAIKSKLDATFGNDRGLFSLRRQELDNAAKSEELQISAYTRAAHLTRNIEVIVAEMSRQTAEVREVISREGQNYLFILILVGGSGILLSILITVTTIRVLARDQAALHLARRDEAYANHILEAVGFSAKTMLTADSWESVIDTVLARLGQATLTSRVYLFKSITAKGGDTSVFTLLHEWCQLGIEPQIDNPDLKSIDMNEAGFSRWARLLGEGKPVFGRVVDFPVSEVALLQEQGVLSLLVCPIMVDHKLWGFIGFDDCLSERVWSKREVNVLNAAADTLGSAIAHDHADHQIRLAATVFENTKEGVLITDKENCIITVNKAFTEITGYAAAEVVGQRPSLLSSGRHDGDFYADMWADIKQRGQWQGEIVSQRKNGSPLPEWLSISTITDRNGELFQYVGVFSDISKLKRTEERLDFLAHHDPLTELPNRLLLTDRLHHALARSSRHESIIAVFFLDLDHFKTINDSLGHHMGDELLKQVSLRLQETLREEDTVARLGGDEFMAVVEDIESSSQVALVADKILKAVAAPISLEGKSLYITTSLGISLFPEHGTSVGELMKNADAAMYKAKESGRNNIQFYTSEITDAVLARLSMENQLRRALEQDEFELHYQPQCNTVSGDIIGMEALIRWRDPESGELIPPDRFLSFAEEAGLILPIGRWVLNTACRQCRVWLDSGFDGIRVAVNLSARQLDKDDLLLSIEDALQQSGLPGTHLELELTESCIMQKPEQAVGILGDIRDLGVTLAIDDFGTGYSSLNYLKLLPFDKLKIDRTFVNDIPQDSDDMAIARAIVGLGHTLQMSVIAEGVETADQYRFLMDIGCNYLQGYLLSRPVSVVDATAVLETGGGRINPFIDMHENSAT